MELSFQQMAALDRSITPIRMGTYLTATGGDPDHARELYLWDRDLSVAFFADLAILEVALRNAMNTRLEDRWGAEWYADPAVPFDDRSSRQLAEAWGRIVGERTPGRLVAQCMFGFWRGLLDKGDHVGRPPRRVRCDYEILWRGVLDKAFPGGRAEARREGKRWERSYALSVVSRLNDLRNRVAHHEPLINGFPLSGQQVRLTAKEAHEDCLLLAAMLDRDLRSLLTATSRVPNLLANRPPANANREQGVASSGLSHVTLIVKDLDRMEQILTTVIGGVRVYDSGTDTFSLSEERFFLVGHGTSATWIAIMRGDTGLMRSYNHIAFQVHPGDLDAMRQAIDDLGLECRPPRSRVDGEGESVYFYDDDNHLFELHTGSLRERLAVYVPKVQSSQETDN